MNKLYANEIPAGDIFHPGEFLKDELDAREMKQQELADKMGIAKTVLSEIIHGKRNLTPVVALKLEEALGINAEFWMKLQVNYEIDIIRKQYHTLIDKTKISNNKKSKLSKAVLKSASNPKKRTVVKVKKSTKVAVKKKQ